jgi:hypothetical protein
MKKEVLENKELHKKSKNIFYIFLFFILIVILIIFYILAKEPLKKPDPIRNYEMEKEFQKIVENEISLENKRKINFSIDKIEVLILENGKTESSIYLFCGWKVNSDTELNVFQNIADKILEKYPNLYGNNIKDKSNVNIICTDYKR